MMRVLFLSADPGVPVLGHKGASVHVRELAGALHSAGADVHVASPRVEPEGDRLEAPVALHAIEPVLPKAHADHAALAATVDRQAEEVFELAQDLRVEAVYERFSLYTAAGARAAAALGIPHVVEVNAPLREEAARFRALPHPEAAATLEREALWDAERVLAVSDPLARRLVADGVPTEAVEVLPNAVDCARFAAPVRDPERFIVGFAGSLKPWHGIEVLVEALAAVPEAHLEVVGHGPCLDALDELPPERVTRLGTLPHDEATAAMARWDAGLAPYLPLEGFWFSPLKVLEYMAAGCCPVVSDLGDARDVLGDGRRGVLVAPGDAAALAEALHQLAWDRAGAWQLGSAARAWVAEERTWAAVAERVLDALHGRTLDRAA
jgi:glycosyltransferase involved in cell wall biosynthesis